MAELSHVQTERSILFLVQTYAVMKMPYMYMLSTFAYRARKSPEYHTCDPRIFKEQTLNYNSRVFKFLKNNNQIHGLSRCRKILLYTYMYMYM